MAGRTTKIKQPTEGTPVQRIAFEAFAATLMPHELEYVWSRQNFKTAENQTILSQLRDALVRPSQFQGFDRSIDKRHYSYVKKWIEEKLQSIDADAYFEQLLELDKKIMTDALGADDERKMLAMIRASRRTDYYFVRFYELIQNYRYYLLIRMRHNYLKTINNFLEVNREAWLRSKAINQELHEATRDIVDQYAFSSGGSKQWEARLISIFEDESLDGLNRYYAIVRLTFMYYNYKEYDKLLELYAQLDQLMHQGIIYSRRILANYYANRLLMHSRKNETDLALYYGRLSIRHKGSDFLFYLTNYCSVLLRSGHFAESLQLLKSNIPEYRNTISPHNRIGFASLYIQSLVLSGKAQQGLNFAKQALEEFRSELFQFRWHLFFTSMLLAQLRLERYREIIRTVKRYDLLSLERSRHGRAGYIPYLQWFYEVARYRECQTDEKGLIEVLRKSSEGLWQDPHRAKHLEDLLAELKHHVADLTTGLGRIN
ncbi:MAG: hypothetical protein LWX09_01885 [Bacteroidia bacterium]|jgi:hypothetical protein|nr:hypothetical protein [Bacteroidia bacterium]